MAAKVHELDRNMKMDAVAEMFILFIIGES